MKSLELRGIGYKAIMHQITCPFLQLKISDVVERSKGYVFTIDSVRRSGCAQYYLELLILPLL